MMQDLSEKIQDPELCMRDRNRSLLFGACFETTPTSARLTESLQVDASR